MKEKRIPERMCVACRQMKPKTQLTRIVLCDGVPQVDTTGKLNGRGVYLCKCKECIARAKKIKNFEKVNGFALSDEIITQLETLIEQ